MKYDIYVINLDRNKERWANMSSQFQLQGITNVKRFSGYDGKKLMENPEVALVHPNALLAAKRGYRISHDEHNFGSIGCYLSHVGAWKQIAESEHKFGVIFEDDITIKEDFEANFTNLLNNAPMKWDMIVFGPNHLVENPRKVKKHGKFTFVKGKFILFNSYVITKECCQKLLQYAFPVRIQVDWWISEQLPFYDFWLVQSPQLTFSNDLSNKSDINHTPVVPDWLVAEELPKYQKEDKPKKPPRTTDGKETANILVIIIVAGIITTTVTATAIAFYLHHQKKNMSVVG